MDGSPLKADPQTLSPSSASEQALAKGEGAKTDRPAHGFQLGRRIAMLLVLGLGVATLAGCSGKAAADSDTRTITIHHSHFSPELVKVPSGRPVTYIIKNEDPIEHEWIVGSSDVHERHRTGTEPYHDQVPTEVTIPALSTRVTTVTLAGPASYLFICHLPGHEEYGMRGTVQVQGR
jgi:uncharacterized cupredoxin-like copper-binding protein